MKYYTKEEFIEKSKVSCSTIDRFYRQYPDIAKERKEEGKRKDIPEQHLKYFDQNLMIKTDQEKDRKIDSLQKIIWLSRDENSLAAKLWHQDWVIFGTVSYRTDYSKDTCYIKMVKMYNQLKENLYDIDLRFFFTTESFDVRGGNHNHFVINCNYRNVNHVKDFIKKHFRWDRIDQRKYNPEEAAIFYIMKEGLQGTDWDYLK